VLEVTRRRAGAPGDRGEKKADAVGSNGVPPTRSVNGVTASVGRADEREQVTESESHPTLNRKYA